MADPKLPTLTPRTIADLAALAYEDKHIKAHKALVHQTPELQLNVYVLDPGGMVPPHLHSSSWDIAFVIEGEIEISVEYDGEMRLVNCRSGALNFVPPGTKHCLRNRSETQIARFLLIQSPAHAFDFVRAGP